MYSEIKIGKIEQLDPITGVGTITTPDDSYLFLMADALDQSLQIEDKVAFRGETVHNSKKAFFVQKAENRNLDNYEVIEDIYNPNND